MSKFKRTVRKYAQTHQLSYQAAWNHLTTQVREGPFAGAPISLYEARKNNIAEVCGIEFWKSIGNPSAEWDFSGDHPSIVLTWDGARLKGDFHAE